MAKKGRMGYFSKIETREDALKMIREVALAFYILAVVLLIIGLVRQTPVLVDALLYTALAFWLQRFNSRIAAVFLLLTGIGLLVLTTVPAFGPQVTGRNGILAAFMIISSIRAIEATFKLHRLSKPASPVDPAEPPPQP